MEAFKNTFAARVAEIGLQLLAQRMFGRSLVLDVLAPVFCAGTVYLFVRRRS